MASLSPSDPIAIVGSSCRFAGQTESPSQLWDLLCRAPDLSRRVPSERFNVNAFYHEDAEYHGTTNSAKAYWLDRDPKHFDAAFFNITPKEAEAMDPQQRLILEVVYESMESAGIPLSKCSGADVGVFAGCMTQDYEVLSGRDELTASQYFPTGNSRALMSNRISYFFNFQGPSMTIDTACSSSLVAMHQAVLSLRAGDCVMACVTGVNLMLTPEQFIAESSLHMLSPSGKCHMWDASADGYARGEGAASLLLKPLSRALADGNKIEAIIRQTGVNGDGKTNGITMPNAAAQSSLISKTYHKAGLDPLNPQDRCQYFEAHGTGTAAGDPREASAIHQAFFAGHGPAEYQARLAVDPEPHKLIVGSVKTIIGHTEAAAGLAGVLKVVWSMKNGKIPPNLHFENLNPTVAPFYSHLLIPTKTMPWPNPPPGQPRRASVNSFGFGGANAHAIVEEYMPDYHRAVILGAEEAPAPKAENKAEAARGADTEPDIAPVPIPIVISAASMKSLREVIKSYRNYLANNDVTVAELSLHQFLRCTGLPYRVAFTATTMAGVVAHLDSLLSRNDSAIPADATIRLLPTNAPLRILGIFTGQGAQWPMMSKTLLQRSAAYRDSIRRLDNVLKTCPYPCSWTLEQLIMEVEDESVINEASVSQPLCTALQIALVDFLRSINVVFHTVIGHSSGEIAAAYASGRLTASDAIIIAYYRGIVAAGAKGKGRKGGMLATNMTEEAAQDFCNDPEFKDRICVAACNSPSSVTLSGDLDAITRAHEKITERNGFSRILKVDTAYHSHHMEGPARIYTEMMKGFCVSPVPQDNGTVWISSVEGRPRMDAQDLEYQYWADNMVRKVQFRGAVEFALSRMESTGDANKYDCAIEVGPNSTLRGPFAQTAKSVGDEIFYTAPLKRFEDSEHAVCDFITALWANLGVAEIDLPAYLQQSTTEDVAKRQLYDLPRYPFEKTAHWRESRLSRQYHFRTSPPHELLGVRAREDNAYELKWRNILKLDKVPWLEHHSFQGQALVPASAYCVMALDAARHYLGGRQASLIELRDIQIMNGIAIDRDSPGVETLFSLVVAPEQKDGQIIDATFSLYSCPANGTTDMKKDVSGSLQIVLGDPLLGALPPRQVPLSETMSADPDAFYKMMETTGLKYTGPFRAMTSIERRFSYSSAVLRRFHEDDSTSLDISPATVDSCFQAAFLSYSSPGDGALWTAFLPTSIGRIQFNLALLGDSSEESRGAPLTVDAHLARISSPTEASSATIAIDLAIFDNQGRNQIQIEDLTVRALANTLPKDDREFYLQTVMDVDPTDEIVRPNESTLYDEQGMILMESCTRIVSFSLKQRRFSEASTAIGSLGGSSTAVATAPLHDDTSNDIDHLVRDSAYPSYLETLKQQSEQDPFRVSHVLPLIMREAPQVAVFRNHVGRIVKQITHRYPWMNILYLPAEGADLTKSLLAAVGTAFQSFTVGVSQGYSPSEGESAAISSLQGAAMKDIDLTGALGDQLAPFDRLDLVLLPSALLGTSGSNGILETITKAMKPGAFLVLLNPHDSILAPAPDYADGSFDRPLTPPYWPDTLDSYGFLKQARNADQFYQFGYVLVRQFGANQAATVTPRGIKNGKVTRELLLITGPAKGSGDELVTNLAGLLSPGCDQVKCRTLDDASVQDLHSCTGVIILADLDEPVISNMTEQRIDKLRALLRPTLAALWVTRDARSGNPEHAASFGFMRTIAAEIPTIKLQALDLDMRSADPPAEIIASTFAALATIANNTDPDSLWTYEPEIHIEQGRRLVPRVIPWKEANDRANSLHRVIERPVNTLSRCIELVMRKSPAGSSSPFEVAIEERESNPHQPQRGHVKIRVDHSSALPIKMSDNVTAYVCVGREWTTGKRIAAFANENASYITVPSCQTLSLHGETLPSLTLLNLLIRSLAALYIISETSHQDNIVLIDPDFELAKCLAGILDLDQTLKITILGTSHDEECKLPGSFDCRCERLELTDVGLGIARYKDVQGHFGHLARSLLHPRTPKQELKRLFARGGIVFNFMGRDDELSRRIKDVLQGGQGNRYRHGLDALCLGDLMESGDFSAIKIAWKAATLYTMQHATDELSGAEFSRTISVKEMHSHPRNLTPFQIVDWRSARDALQTVHYMVDENVLSPDKTYLLLGITRDFGHSLCRLFLEQGARNIVLASRNPDTSPKWAEELCETYGAHIRVERADVTKMGTLIDLKRRIQETMPPVGGVINGSMVLEDRVFAQMTIESWKRVLHPKTIGSANLDTVFNEPDLEFFIMTSSFAAIGGHAGQSNYAAANMYMNGLAANRRRRGLAGSVLNIGVIYGLGFLQREKTHLYAGLERDGYAPISEHNLHHMFIEAIVAGRPDNHKNNNTTMSRQPFEITTGLKRFRRGEAEPLHWHRDPRFGHFATPGDAVDAELESATQLSLMEQIAGLNTREEIAEVVGAALEARLEMLLQLPQGSIDRNNSLGTLGVDSLAAVEVRNWLYKALGKEISVIKILEAATINRLCLNLADQILGE
ncbi:beta-ketoacyl synthase domain-containing protein [Xylariaceae sp. FL0594]|nr:beta-ketoacyl synthase domain-containing protein [Xylariaceae sp. FL0594]